MATMYEKIIQELEEENKSLTNQVSLHQNESNTNELLEEALEALNLMRLKVSLLLIVTCSSFLV